MRANASVIIAVRRSLHPSMILICPVAGRRRKIEGKNFRWPFVATEIISTIQNLFLGGFSFFQKFRKMLEF